MVLKIDLYEQMQIFSAKKHHLAASCIDLNCVKCYKLFRDDSQCMEGYTQVICKYYIISYRGLEPV